MYSLIINCCETHFRLLGVVSRSSIGKNTNELFLFFY